ncbi:MAG: class I SAM-dependent methyltransferase [Gemmatimonadales bacterium]|nr:MAG: class I SAM-dependent methyltransferase [Gemmatimonadales bacterium]
MLEPLLAFLSRKPEGDVPVSEAPGSADGALDQLRVAFPGLDTMVGDRRVVDFGCGHGRQAVGLVQLGAKSVAGIDINEGFLEVARAHADRSGAGARVRFFTSLPEAEAGNWDLVISQDAMEHFGNPDRILGDMFRILAPGGRAAITFSPPWLHPYGAHMHFFTPVPWVHLLFPERTVMRVRSRFRDDGAERYEDVEGGLNRMTLRRFEALVDRSPFIVESLRFTAIRGLPLVSRTPVLREFVTSRVDCILRKP